MTLLELAKEITPVQYLELENPIFEAQSCLDDKNMYWMIFRDNAILYKIHNTL